MTKEEITYGLKRAIEKGDSLDLAVQSFINAGYNAAEVQAAASTVSSSASSLLKPSIEKPVSIISQKSESASTKMVIGIIVLLVLILISLGIYLII
jgi:cobalamin biosynthesis Mg chelatase CobN